MDIGTTTNTSRVSQLSVIDSSVCEDIRTETSSLKESLLPVKDSSVYMDIRTTTSSLREFLEMLVTYSSVCRREDDDK